MRIFISGVLSSRYDCGLPEKTSGLSAKGPDGVLYASAYLFGGEVFGRHSSTEFGERLFEILSDRVKSGNLVPDVVVVDENVS